MKKLAPAKLNIYLKLTKKRGIYHELKSRFVRFEALSDEIIFEKKQSLDEFELVGDFGCKNESNTITKAYKVLKSAGFENELKEFFKSYRVRVEKNIPECSGLGGGSSDCASFMLLCNEVLNLKLSKSKLINLGLKIGADVPFFISEAKSANVSGIGEVIQEIDDDVPPIKLIYTDVKCSTPAVFRAFNEEFKCYNPSWELCSSKMLLSSFKNTLLNDLFLPAVSIYDELKKYEKRGCFLSGSGSSVFEVENG